MKINQKVVQITEGIFSTTIDMTLSIVACTVALSLPRFSGNGVFKARLDAENFLESVNYESIKHGFIEARRRGLLQKGRKGKRSVPQITAAGRKRLLQSLPTYDEKRIWDGKIYLITYDIPEKFHGKRKILRGILHRLKAGMLQASAYITLYDPREFLEQKIYEYTIPGTVIVSDVGKDGSIGSESIKELVHRVYDLSTLNERYEAWVKENAKALSFNSYIKYLAILKDDPQLPFSLLPTWWKGKEAWNMIQPLIKSIGNS